MQTANYQIAPDITVSAGDTGTPETDDTVTEEDAFSAGDTAVYEGENSKLLSVLQESGMAVIMQL